MHKQKYKVNQVVGATCGLLICLAISKTLMIIDSRGSRETVNYERIVKIITTSNDCHKMTIVHSFSLSADFVFWLNSIFDESQF